MINIVESTNFRKKDAVKILIRTSRCWINKTTFEIVTELPIDADVSEWYEKANGGRLRKEETGDVYEIAHDVEDSPYHYVEVFPTPESYCEITSPYYNWDFNLYPTYKGTVTYAKGDRVTYNNMEWESDFDDNIGNTPNIWGWSLVVPYVERRDVQWATLEELASA